MRLNSIYSNKNDRLDYDDMNYRRRVITIDDNIELENIAEKEFQSALTEEEKKRQNSLWEDLEFVCGGKFTSKYLIIYMNFYLQLSLRDIAQLMNVTHTAVDKRKQAALNSLRYLYGLDTDRIPYRKEKGGKLS